MGIGMQRITLGVALVVVGFVLFVFGFLVAIITFEEWKVVKEITPSFTTLVAAFFGAWFAYLLQLRAKEEKYRKEILASANQVLFSLFQRVNSLKLFQMDNIDPLRGNPGIHIAMQPILSMKEEVIKFDIEKIDFLLGTNHKQIVFDLYIEDRRYETALNIIDHRSNLHLYEVQPKLHEAGVTEGVDYPESVYMDALGEMLYKHLEKSTKQVVYNVDRTVTSTIETKDKLLAALKEVYPGEEFINFELLESNT